ncbi:Oidioi.mRNA.OKI2018_I69.XSR.g15899.t2.cds [Oikopleura dioica]|uniref:Oidioi.mRNA.OKI2018_I69.XSR.g15899.t2.cds n=1 Tax=Oikopleura dioica TaxID=34765 RepID=A0ABN7SJB9_OIKDI|nr:Oidioi.mRNA.OKI2018_I69.XSR.g15899.t2.cds [Oikopleura dioica]
MSTESLSSISTPSPPGAYLLVAGITRDCTVKQLIECFQQASAIRFSIDRNMNPEDLEATLEFDNKAAFDSVHTKIMAKKMCLHTGYIRSVIQRGANSFPGVRHHELMSFLKTFRPKAAPEKKATRDSDPSAPRQANLSKTPAPSSSTFLPCSPISQPPGESKGNQPALKNMPKPMSLNNPPRPRPSGTRGGDFSPQVAAYPPPASPQTVSTTDPNRQILITQKNHLPILPNGNFKWDDTRRVCRFCNIPTPNMNQFGSHSMGKKHLKNVEHFKNTGHLRSEIQQLVDAGSALWQLPPPGSKGSKLCAQKKTAMQKSIVDELHARKIYEYCPTCNCEFTSRGQARDHYLGKPHDKQFRKKTLERQIPKKLVFALEHINSDLNKTWQNEVPVLSEMPPDWEIDYRKYSQTIQKRKGEGSSPKFANKFNEITKRNSSLYEEAYKQRDKKQFATPIQADSVVAAGMLKQRDSYSIIAPKPNWQAPKTSEDSLETGEVVCDLVEELSDEEEVIVGLDETLDKLYERNTRQK